MGSTAAAYYVAVDRHPGGADGLVVAKDSVTIRFCLFFRYVHFWYTGLVNHPGEQSICSHSTSLEDPEWSVITRGGTLMDLSVEGKSERIPPGSHIC